MQQLLHVLLVDPIRGEALATRCGSAWLLPIVATPERFRGAPALHQWAAGLGLPGDIVGQWLGRYSAHHDSVDWLVVVNLADDRVTPTVAHLTSIPLAVIASTPGCVDFQTWAIQQALSTNDLPRVPGPFGTITWLRVVQAWCADAIGHHIDGCRCLSPLRVTPWEVTLEVKMAGRTLYFKGLAPERAAEAVLTAKLSIIAPQSFPATVKLETQTDGATWWLMDACDGSLLSSAPTVDRAAQ